MFHGASISEIKSIIPIIKHLTKKDSKIKILITSVTLSSAKIVETEFKNFENICHHYFPLDVPFLTSKFLDIWKPKLVIFIDSEIWPNFLYEIKKRNLQSNCRILGHLNKDDLKMMYFCSDLIISMPLKPEGFGRIISESLAMNKMILAHNSGGVKNQIDKLIDIYKINSILD